MKLEDNGTYELFTAPAPKGTAIAGLRYVLRVAQVGDEVERMAIEIDCNVSCLELIAQIQQVLLALRKLQPS